MANRMSASEVLDRARFLMGRHGRVSVDELVHFCHGGVDPSDAYTLLGANFIQDPSGKFIDQRSPMSSTGIMSRAQMQALAQMSQSSYTGTGINTADKQLLQGLQPPKLSVNGNEKQAKPSKSPFKKGDRVEIITIHYEEISVGSLGTVERVFSDLSGCEVFIDGIEGFPPYAFPFNSIKLYNKPKVTIASVVLHDDKKEEIRAAISQQEHATTIFDKWGFGTVFEKGTAISLLFWGVPGTGKTLMAQAVADEFNADLKIYSTADIQSSEPGGAERMIRTIFKEASKHNKSKGRGRVILFDECDSLLMDRNEVGPILGAEVNALLTEIERYEGIVIFTTNRLGKLDPALERRLSAKIEFEFPDKKARLAIWQRMIPKQAPLAKDVDFPKLAGYAIAGGNIKNAVLNAARHAAYKGHKEIAHTHFEEAIKREVASQKAFQDEYKNQTHTSHHGYARTGQGVSINRSVNKTMSINKTLQMGAKDNED